MKVYLVLEYDPYEGFSEPDDVVYDSREKAEARVEELRKEYESSYTIFEMDVK